MPRDKTATYERISRCMKEEFLTYGYEKASLNRYPQRLELLQQDCTNISRIRKTCFLVW